MAEPLLGEADSAATGEAPRRTSTQDLNVAGALDFIVHQDVKELWNQLGQKMPLQVAVGPAIKFGILNWILTWSGYYFVPEYTEYLMGGGGDQNFSSHNITSSSSMDNFANYSKLHAWGVFVPGLLVLAALEVVCLRYVALPIIEVIGHQNLLCSCIPGAWQFRLWTTAQTALSILAKLDLVTTGIFTATAVTLFRGPYGNVYNQMWTATRDENGWMPLDLSAQVEVLWWLMYLQALYGVLWSLPLPTIHYALAHGFPRCFEHRYLKWALMTDVTVSELRFDHNEGLNRPFQAIAYEWIEGGDACCTDRSCVDLQNEIVDFWLRECTLSEHILPKYQLPSVAATREFIRGGQHAGTMYQTLLDAVSHWSVGKTTWSDHGSALFALAYSTRMVSITGFVLPYSQQRMEDHSRADDKMSAFGVMSRIIRTHTFKVLLQGVVQSGLNLHLQVALFGLETLLHRSLANGKQVPTESVLDGSWTPTHWILNWGMFFNILVGLGNFVVNWISEVRTIYWVRSQVWSSQHNFLHTSASGPAARCWRGVLRKQLWWLQGMFVVYTVLVLWVIWQLWQVFTCPSSLAGIGPHGCASYPDAGFL